MVHAAARTGGLGDTDHRAGGSAGQAGWSGRYTGVTVGAIRHVQNPGTAVPGFSAHRRRLLHEGDPWRRPDRGTLPHMSAWHDWYHCTANTYGVWLPGDDRGWYTRHARTQPAADAGTVTTSLHAHSTRTLAREPVHLTPEARRIALGAFVGALHHHGIEAIICAVDDHHATRSPASPTTARAAGSASQRRRAPEPSHAPASPPPAESGPSALTATPSATASTRSTCSATFRPTPSGAR